MATAIDASSKNSKGDWIRYNPLTSTYDTRDGTSVASELVDNIHCLADVLYIGSIRSKQREVLRAQRITWPKIAKPASG